MKNLPDICYKCGLYQQGCKTPYISGSGSIEPDILFVGEAPGEVEDLQGEPFVGKSGKLLRDSIEAMEFNKVRFTNVVRCRPPDNRVPSANEIKYCSQYLVDEIAETMPKVVVLLGATPLKAVLGLGPISSYQGQAAIEQDGIKYVACYHPSYVERQGRRGQALEDWQQAMGRIAEALEGIEPPKGDADYQYIFPETVEEVEKMRDELLADKMALTASDIEGTGLRVDVPNKVISIAFAQHKLRKAWSFPIDHKQSWWTPEERNRVVEIVAEVLTKGRIINHNIKFDCKFIRHFLGIDFVPVGDTIQLSRLVNPEMIEHGLKRLAGVHLQMFDYDEELRTYVKAHPECDFDKGGTYDNVPLEILLPYGGKDVSATVMLHEVLYPQLTDKQRVLYDQMLTLGDYALGIIEENGFKLDYQLIRRYMNVYQAIMDTKYMPEMLKDVHVQRYIQGRNLYTKLEVNKLVSKVKEGKKYKCTLLYPEDLSNPKAGYASYIFYKEDWPRFYLQNKEKLDLLYHSLPELSPKRWFVFNPNSGQQVAAVLYTHKGLPVPAETDTGQPSVERVKLKELVFDLQGEGKSDDFLTAYMSWKLLSSIVSKTYNSMLNPGSDWYSQDGRTRSTYTIGGAKTGRTSSAQPNLQNIPAIEKEPGTVLQFLPAKNAFTHTFPGGGLAMLDYSGMELRVMASIAGIQGMIDVFARKGDVHRYTSSLIYGKPEDQITKFERYRGKWCNWSLLYLGDWWTLMRLYRINGLTEDESKRIAKLYFEAFPELKVYHKTIEQFLREHGYVESAFGRRLPLPAFKSSQKWERSDALRTGVNMPIQGVASDTLIVALAIIIQLMRGKGYQSRFVNTVHDSLVIDYHPDERDELVALAQDVMENVVDYAKEWMPGLDFSWLKVPLVSDVEYGTHYGSYGFYEPPTCTNCGAMMLFQKDIHKMTLEGKEEMVVGYDCASCGHEEIKKFKPLMYNNTHPEAIRLERMWNQVYSNRLVTERTARL